MIQLGFLSVSIKASRLSFFAFNPAVLFPKTVKFCMLSRRNFLPPLLVLFIFSFFVDFPGLENLCSKLGDTERGLYWDLATGSPIARDSWALKRESHGIKKNFV